MIVASLIVNLQCKDQTLSPIGQEQDVVEGHSQKSLPQRILHHVGHKISRRLGETQLAKCWSRRTSSNNRWSTCHQSNLHIAREELSPSTTYLASSSRAIAGAEPRKCKDRLAASSLIDRVNEESEQHKGLGSRARVESQTRWLHLSDSAQN